MKLIPVLLIQLFLLIGCSRSGPETVPEHLSEIQNLTVYNSKENAQYDIELNLVEVFEESEHVMFGRIYDIAVDEKERVYLSEFNQNKATIHAFEQDGSYLTSIGRYGGGPGEFRSIVSPQIYNNYLYAFDVRQMKINVFSLDSFSIERSIRLDRQSWSDIEELNGASPYDFTVIDSDKLLMTFIKSEGNKDLLFRYKMNQSGEIISGSVIQQLLAEHFIHPDTKSITYSPFSSNGLLAVTSNDYLYTVWTEEILFKKHTLDGQYIRSFYHPFSNKDLGRDDVLNYRDSESYKASVRHTGIPESWPAIHSVVADDLNNLWISTITDDENVYEWWILTGDGEIVSRFQWPKNRDIQVVRNGSLYALETEPNTGIRKVVKYEFDFE